MTILITGASRGIGAALAHALTGSGHRVLLVSRSAGLLHEVADSCNREARRELAFGIPFDLEELPARQEKFLSAVRSRTDTLDALVNNAGHLYRKPFVEVSPEEYRQIFHVNLFAPSQLIRICLPLMKESKLKHVVNVTSMAGFQGSKKFPGLSFYSASKAALGGLTECLAAELEPEGVRVNALALGSVQTEMLETAFPGIKAPMKPARMAEFMKWFVLEGAGYFNGKILPVNRSTP